MPIFRPMVDFEGTQTPALCLRARQSVYRWMIAAIVLGTAILGQPIQVWADAGNANDPGYSFRSVADFLPAELAGPLLQGVELATQDMLLVRSNNVVYLVKNGVATRIIGHGEPLPDGEAPSVLNMTFIVASPTHVLFHNMASDFSTRYYLWLDGEITRLEEPANTSFDRFTLNQNRSRILAVRGVFDALQDQTGVVYYVTDGVNKSVEAEFPADGRDRQVRAITEDGGLLMDEKPGGAAQRIFWEGARSGTLVNSSAENILYTVMVANERGDALIHESTFLNPLYQDDLLYYPGEGGQVDTIARAGASGPYDNLYANGSVFGFIGAQIGEQGVPVFVARVKETPQTEYGYFTGPDPATHRFGGDFVTGFGQPGQVKDVVQVLGNRVLVKAELGDGTLLDAIGETESAPAIRWTLNDNGGWSEAAHWTPARVPGIGDSALFDLPNSYQVRVGARDVGAVRVEAGNVAFVGRQLDVADRLEVGGTATLHVDVSDLTSAHLSVGHLPGSVAGEPAVLRLFDSSTFDSSNAVTTTARAVIGDQGPGVLRVENGSMNTGEARIGVGAQGTVFVSGASGRWTVQSLAVGANVTGTLDIGESGFVATQETVIGFGDLVRNFRGTVFVDPGDAQPEGDSWRNSGPLTVGAELLGLLQIESGGLVYVGDVLKMGTAAHAVVADFDGQIDVIGTGAAADRPSELEVEKDVHMGIAQGASAGLHVNEGGQATLRASLLVGEAAGSVGIVEVSGVNANGARARMDVGTESGVELCAIGVGGVGRVDILQGGLLLCQGVTLGGLAGSAGHLRVEGAAGDQKAEIFGTIFCIGGFTLCGTAPEAVGTLTVGPGGLVIADQVVVGVNGLLAGSSQVQVAQPMQVLGKVTPGGSGASPAGFARSGASFADGAVTAQASAPGTLEILGSMVLSETAQVELVIWGTQPALQSRLVVTGALTIAGGELVLHFGNGFAPVQGDRFAVIEAAGGISGAFDEVRVTGLGEGFEYETALVDNALELVALTDGNPGSQPTTRRLYVPHVGR